MPTNEEFIDIPLADLIEALRLMADDGGESSETLGFAADVIEALDEKIRGHASALTQAADQATERAAKIADAFATQARADDAHEAADDFDCIAAAIRGSET